MKTIQISLTEAEARAFCSWVQWNREEMDRIADHYARTARMGCYMDNSNPNRQREQNALAIGVAEKLTKMLTGG